jgi:hypothetical protein
MAMVGWSISLIGKYPKQVHIGTVNVTFEFASGEDYSQYCQAVSAAARIALSKETEERKEAIWRKVAEESGGIMKLLMGL